MSEENKKTLEVYKEKANIYLSNSRKIFCNFLLESICSLIMNE